MFPPCCVLRGGPAPLSSAVPAVHRGPRGSPETNSRFGPIHCGQSRANRALPAANRVRTHPPGTEKYRPCPANRAARTQVQPRPRAPAPTASHGCRVPEHAEFHAAARAAIDKPPRVNQFSLPGSCPFGMCTNLQERFYRPDCRILPCTRIATRSDARRSRYAYRVALGCRRALDRSPNHDCDSERG